MPRQRLGEAVSGAIPNSVVRWAAARGAPVARLSGHTSLGSAALAQTLAALAKPPKRLWSRTGRGSIDDVADRIGRDVEDVRRWQAAGMLTVGDDSGSMDRASFDRAALVDLALRNGATEATLSEAAAKGALVWAALESVLTSGGSFTGAQAAETAGVDMELLRSVWESLGLPTGGLERAAFKRRDVHALRTLAALQSVFSAEEMGEASSVVGRAMAEVSSAMTDLFRKRLADPLLDAGGTDVDVVIRLAAMRDLLVPTLAPLLEIALERHLEVAIRAEMGVRMEALLEPGTGHRMLAIGFADLVGFTTAAEQRSPGEAQQMASRLLRLAETALAAHGGRIVKSIGDAVMYTTPGPLAAAAASLDIVEAVAGEATLPPVRAGIAYGPVLPAYADYFGRTVNLASRLCGAGEPGSVVLSAVDAVADAAWRKAGLVATPVDVPPLKGIEEHPQGLRITRA